MNGVTEKEKVKCVHLHASAHGGQKMSLDPQELEFRAAVSHLRVQGLNLLISVLNC